MALNSNFRTLTADNIEGIVDEKNYLKSSFENGTTVGWTEMNVTLTSGLPTGTPTISASAAGSFELSTTTTQPLSGSRSLLVNVPTGLGVGDGFISQEFTLDRMDYGKVLTVSFDYERVSGTYNFSGVRGSQTWLVYVYDATAGGANWIQPAGFLGMNQSQGPGRVSCTFQSSVVSGQKYRVAVIASQAAAGASSIKFDNFTCSRQPVSVGTPVTDWQSYTPTITAVTTNPTLPTSGLLSHTARYRRVGDSVELQWFFETGTVSGGNNGSGTYRFGLPAGLSIDSSKLPSTTGTGTGTNNGSRVVGNFCISSRDGVMWVDSSNFLIAGVESGGTDLIPVTGANSSLMTTNNLTASFTARVPVTGWSSSVQTSDSADTRVVDFKVRGLSSSTITSGTPLSWATVSKNSHGTFNGTNTYTVPVSGDYCFTAFFYGFSAAMNIEVRKNGVIFDPTTFIYTDSGARRNIANTFLLQDLVAGDQITLVPVLSATSSIPASDTFSMFRLSGPSAIAATETVAAAYYASAGTTSTVTTPANFDTRIFDTHNAVTTGASWRFTAPISGKYSISTYLYLSGTVSAYARIYKNGVFLLPYAQYNSSAPASVSSGIIVNLNAGDYIQLRSTNSIVFGGGAIGSSDQTSHISIVRVGN